MTIAKTRHESTIITSNSVSIGPASSEAASPNQSNWSRTTELTTVSTTIAASRRRYVARVTAADSIDRRDGDGRQSQG